MAGSQGQARLYLNVCLIECATTEALDELVAVTPIERYILARLSDRVILVDGEQRLQIQRALGRRGRPFRIVDVAPATVPSDPRPTR